MYIVRLFITVGSPASLSITTSEIESFAREREREYVRRVTAYQFVVCESCEDPMMRKLLRNVEMLRVHQNDAVLLSSTGLDDQSRSQENYDRDFERQCWETWTLSSCKIFRTAYRLPCSAGTPRIFLRAFACSLGFPSFLIPIIIIWSKFDLADRVAPFHFAYSHPALHLSLYVSNV